MRVKAAKSILVSLLALALLPAASGISARGAEPSSDAANLTDAQVVASMKRAIDFLLKSETGDNWEHPVTHDDVGGETALVLYALLHAGQSLEDDPIAGKLTFRSPELVPAIKYLTQRHPVATYTTGLQANALTLFIRTPDTIPILKEDHDYLIAAMGSHGGYNYNAPPANQIRPNYFLLLSQMDDLKSQFNQARSNGDVGTENALNQRYLQLQGLLAADQKAFAADKDFNNANLSTAQYGTLGAWALADEGIEFPMWYWLTTDKFWRLCQQPDGGWFYFPTHAKGEENEVRSMTTAGLASLYVASEFIDQELRLENKKDPALDNGLKKLSDDFDPALQNYYYMYGIERVGLASGYKFFGTHDWYREGAANIIKGQHDDGSYSVGDFTGTSPNIATAYALLFLARGRNPVVFNKLEYAGNCWDARPRDDANITRWMSKKFERPINWQIVNLNVDAEQWTDAPVLLITGSRAPQFTEADIEKLRAYIYAGGTIFSSADGNSADFTEAIKRIAAKVVNNQYEMHLLKPDDVLFSSALWAKVNNPPRMLAMSNGIRELWIHSTVDMGASWQMRRVSNTQHFDIPANLYFYASGKATLHSKLRTLAVAAADAVPARTITVGRLEYSGNWDPEPGAWPRFAKIAAAAFHTKLEITPIDAKGLDPAQQPLVDLTGSTGFTLAPEDLAKIKAYIDGGGTLFVDAGGGNANFVNSFTKFAPSLSSDATLEPIPADDPLFTNALPDSIDTRQTTLRKYALGVLGRQDEPHFLGIRQHGRWAVILSPEDVSSGFLDTNTWGIVGYDSQSSQNLARNIVLYAASPKPQAAAPEAQPATGPAAAAN